ncbi:MAG: Ldh family oxidoreductase, partial [Pseudomonadota bacterium]
YDMPLLGGDTIAATGASTYGITALGRATHTPVPTRKGAKPGDALYVTGVIGEAMLGPSSPECNWFVLAVDTRRFRQPGALQAAAEDLLADLRNCPPARGFDRVEIPGEREREQRRRSNGAIAVPTETWRQVLALASQLEEGSAQ